MPANRFNILVVITFLLHATDLPAQEASEESRESELAKQCETADYILVGTIRDIEFRGETGPPDTETRHWFYDFQITHEQDLSGQLKERHREASEMAGREMTDELIVHSLLANQAPLADELGEGIRCIVWLQNMRAGAMAGTVPVSMLDIQPVNDELLERVQELVAERNGDD